MTNDNPTNGELSIEELEAIAAGWPHWVHSAVHAVEGFANAVGSAVNATHIFGNHNTAVGFGVLAELGAAGAVVIFAP